MQFPSALPAARLRDPFTAPILRWGILGPGWIAQRFVSSVQRNTRQNIAAVGGTSLEKAQDFADQYHIKKAYGSSEELIQDNDIDVIYISTPHPSHFPCALKAIMAGKHVLIEKPLALNVNEISKLTEEARKAKVFMMEAMWTWFLPKFDVLTQILEEEIIGDIHSVIADHGEHFTSDHRIMRADLAGGPLLDLGLYPVSLATKILGPAQTVLATGQKAPSGVNGQANIILSHHGNKQSSIHTTLLGHTPGSAVLSGTKGYIFLDGMFYKPGNFQVYNNDKRVIIYEEPKYSYDELFHEAIHLAYCVGDGLIESPIHSLYDSRVAMDVIDKVRNQLGIVFNEERNIRVN